jgi:phospho-N-acetylmuramoyl-pentapeptide-transferase
MRQILIAGAIALLFSLFGTRGLIKILATRGYGQIIRDDGPSSHHIKRGTPTMGGIILIAAALMGYFDAKLAHNICRTCFRVGSGIGSSWFC